MKGISPVVGVVLLIAIAVTAVASIYFWAGGLSAAGYGDDEPTIQQISARRVSCTPGAAGTLQATIINMDVTRVDTNLTLAHDSGLVTVNGVSIMPGASKEVTFNNAGLTRGKAYVIVGSGQVGQAVVVC
ncbi:MAG: type IV pilin [Candidatus Diapherotrites archaeon]|nr:type IV pilin [Candidatus Diapherotrites archaeon]